MHCPLYIKLKQPLIDWVAMLLFIKENSVQIFGKVFTINNNKKSHQKAPEWFDNNCRTAKCNFHNAKITLITISPTQTDNNLYIIEQNITLFEEKQNIDIR